MKKYWAFVVRDLSAGKLNFAEEAVSIYLGNTKWLCAYHQFYLCFHHELIFMFLK